MKQILLSLKTLFVLWKWSLVLILLYSYSKMFIECDKMKLLVAKGTAVESAIRLKTLIKILKLF